MLRLLLTAVALTFAAGACGTVSDGTNGEICDNNIDDDGDNKVDEQCGGPDATSG